MAVFLIGALVGAALMGGVWAVTAALSHCGLRDVDRERRILLDLMGRRR